MSTIWLKASTSPSRLRAIRASSGSEILSGGDIQAVYDCVHCVGKTESSRPQTLTSKDGRGVGFVP